MNRLAITRIKRKNRNFISYIALNEKREFVDFYLYPDDEDCLLGNIFIGRVEHVVPNIQAAFVKISPALTCYLPLSEIKHAVFTRRQSEKKPICEGDELLVQVAKEAVKTKNPVVSAKLTFSGRYSVLTTGNQTLSVSKKLSAELRSDLRELLNEICRDHEAENYGIVLRTNAQQAKEEELKRDLVDLKEEYCSLMEKCSHLSAYTKLYQPCPEYIRRLQAVRDFSDSTELTNSYDGIYTDIPEIYEQIADFLPYLVKQNLLHRYQDEQVTLQTLYNIEGNIEKLLSDRIWLKSGANIIIEQLETLTFIDVNSAKNVKKDSLLLAINTEAAVEAARQLRLRNISGMILIDFINMESPEAQEELICRLKSELKKDVVPCQFMDITKLGLVEITRKKICKSLKEIVDDQPDM